ncbi:MAG TPA: DVUA0089 family protein [Phycisphaerales bacterium]|nr:DVUA0089 family protein [Phycisphaerales bacterium]
MRPHVIPALASFLTLAGVTTAQPVLESEADGSAINNSIASAQSVAPGAFAANINPNVFGALPTASVQGRLGLSDVDFYSFTAPAGNMYFDVDGAAPTLDTYLALFSASGTLLADSEDSFPADPGSATDRDAFIGQINLPAGAYFIAVAASGNFANATFTGPDPLELFRPDGEFGGFAFPAATTGDASFLTSGPQTSSLGYTLSITVIPAPSAAGLLAAAAALRLRRRR